MFAAVAGVELGVFGVVGVSDAGMVPPPPAAPAGGSATGTFRSPLPPPTGGTGVVGTVGAEGVDGAAGVCVSVFFFKDAADGTEDADTD